VCFLSHLLHIACSRSEPKRHGVCFLVSFGFLVSKLARHFQGFVFPSLAVGDPVDLKTGDNGMNTGWTVLAINQGLVRIAHSDTSEVREVPAGDLIYMPF
jgi:hypothetical protein